MGNKFFNKKENRRCSCCKFAVISDYMDNCFCKKKGIVDKNDYCHKFKYDVLKRVPDVITPKSDFNKEDFSID